MEVIQSDNSDEPLKKNIDSNDITFKLENFYI